MASLAEPDLKASSAAGRDSNGLSLSLRRLSRSFGGNRVLNDVDLEVAPGEFIGVVGRSGSGKSTLLRLSAALDKPTSGAVLLDGVPVTGLHPGVRVMFQEPRLLPWKRVGDNVSLGLPPRTAKAQAAAALGQVGLADRTADWPAILSGGQKQRIALARALAANPRLLLLDEPLGALDALTRREMQQLVEDVWRANGFTAVLITHDVEEAIALCDRVILLEGGRITMDVPVPLPRPRRRDAAAFIDLREAVLAHLLGGAQEKRDEARIEES